MAMDDAEIIRRVTAGEVDLFETLVNRYRVHVARIVSRHVPRDRVDELCQDTFIRAYRSLGTVKKGVRFKSWISSIATRSCYDHWRRVYRNREILESEMTPECEERVAEAFSTASQEKYREERTRNEARELLQALLNTLSPEDRMVLELVHLEGLSGREAAELLGWSVANVKIRAFRARSKLKKALEAEGM